MSHTSRSVGRRDLGCGIPSVGGKGGVRHGFASRGTSTCWKVGGILAVRWGNMASPLWAPFSAVAQAEVDFIYSLYCAEPAD